MNNPFRTLCWALALLALVVLQGCGFHLRTVADLPPSISPIHIEGLAQNDPMLETLRQVLTEANTQLADSQGQAKTRLRLRNQNFSRRVLSVDSGGKVLEYELHHAFDFDLVDRDGNEKVAKQTVGIQRSYENPETEVLGKQREEAQMREEMRMDLARAITDILRAQAR
jgi:LPS-assembly lipoprotein